MKFDRHHSGKTSSFNLRLILWEAGISVSNKVLECLVLRYEVNRCFMKIDFSLMHCWPLADKSVTGFGGLSDINSGKHYWLKGKMAVVRQRLTFLPLFRLRLFLNFYIWFFKQFQSYFFIFNFLFFHLLPFLCAKVVRLKLLRYA